MSVKLRHPTGVLILPGTTITKKELQENVVDATGALQFESTIIRAVDDLYTLEEGKEYTVVTHAPLVRPPSPPKLLWKNLGEEVFKEMPVKRFMEADHPYGAYYVASDVLAEVGSGTSEESLANKFVIVRGDNQHSPSLADFPAKESVGTVLKRVIQSCKPLKQKSSTNIPLKERSKQLEQVVAHVACNLKLMTTPKKQITNTAKTDLVIPTFAGGSGIGKTTLALESARKLFDDWQKLAPFEYQDAKLLYLMVDFSNGGKLLTAETFFSPSCIIGLRLAYTHFIQGNFALNFPEFVIGVGDSAMEFTIASVMEAIRLDLRLQDEPIFIVLHIDEVQFIFDFEKDYKWETNPQPKGLFKLLIYEICTFFTLGKSTIQSFISGTAHRKVMQSKEPTMYTFQFIDMPPLSLQAVLELIGYYAHLFNADPFKWKLQLSFLQVISDMGGLPRAISYLLETCFGVNFSNGRLFFEKISTISFNEIFAKVAHTVDSKYGLEGFILNRRDAALQVLNCAIRNISVTRDQVFGDVMIEQMEQDGHIFLDRVEPAEYYFRMPFLFIFIYDQYLRIIPHEMSRVAFNPDHTVQWQDWEVFNAHFQVFMNNLLVTQHKVLPLGEFYRNADGDSDTKNLPIGLKPLEVARLQHQFPASNEKLLLCSTASRINWTTHGYLLLNGKSASFGDTVLIREPVQNTAKTYFKAKATISHIIVSGQQKWDYNGEEFTVEQAVKEHQKALETAKRAGLKNCGLVTVIFTTQALPQEDIGCIPKGILIIHQGNFKDYYGPFADRASFAVAHTLNPNFADQKHLQALEGVGEKAAISIVEECRKRPFTDENDLFQRVPAVKKKKITRTLSFFPISSKRLSAPFPGIEKPKDEF